MARRKYSDEYKRETVALSELPGATITGVARDLGINGHMLGRWRKPKIPHVFLVERRLSARADVQKSVARS